MNYGDGWYGGVFVGAMYSLAFVSNDMEYIVTRALETIPEQSEFFKCIKQVIGAWQEDPNDWTYAWYKVEKNWSEDIGCPEDAHHLRYRFQDKFCIHRHRPALWEQGFRQDHRHRRPVRTGFGLQPGLCRRDPGRSHRLLKHPGNMEKGAETGRRHGFQIHHHFPE